MRLQIRRVRVAPLPNSWGEVRMLRDHLRIWGQDRVTMLRPTVPDAAPEMTFPGSSLPW